MAKDYERSAGTVFHDLGFPDAAQEALKADLTVQIFSILKNKGLTQAEAAKILGTTQAQVSALMRCRPTAISVGRLMHYLTMLGQNVSVSVTPCPQKRKKSIGQLTVSGRRAMPKRTQGAVRKHSSQPKKPKARHAA